MEDEVEEVAGEQWEERRGKVVTEEVEWRVERGEENRRSGDGYRGEKGNRRRWAGGRQEDPRLEGSGRKEEGKKKKEEKEVNPIGQFCKRDGGRGGLHQTIEP